jgi:PAS domain-containing protein
VSLSNEAVQQTLLGDAADHADVGMVVWNEERRYVAVNAAACRLLHTTREALLETHVGDNNRSPETRGTVDQLIAHVPARGTMTIARADESSIEVEWVVFPTSLAGLPHIVGLMWDRNAL